MTATSSLTPFASQADKEHSLLPELAQLVEHHRSSCQPYGRILAAIGHPSAGPGGAGYGPASYQTLADLPWLPVRMFKTHQLKSVPDADVVKVLTSSGTTGAVSRIYIDRPAAAAQTRALSGTLGPVLGPQRLPMLIVDGRSVMGDRRSATARGAGALGLINFGRDHTWMLDEADRPDRGLLGDFLARHGGSPFLIFGFTFMVWLYLYEVARADGLDLSNAILIHSGGWKKLADRAVDPAEFRRRFAEDTGLVRMHNFYGMVEQIGTIFLEGPSGGSLYCPDFADVIIRDPLTWREQPVGEPGVIEVLSTLPTSYPGHVLLTEDLGVIDGVDDGDWPGKRFTPLGRLPAAEARGCSDTYAAAA